MLMPSIFGESLFDDFMDDFAFAYGASQRPVLQSKTAEMRS